MSEPSEMLDAVYEAVSAIETACHPLNGGVKYGHAHADLNVALNALGEALALANQRAEAAEAERELLQRMVSVAANERDALRKDAARFVVDDAMVERVARKLAERYSANVTTDEHDAWLLFQTSFMLEARCLIDAALAVPPEGA